MLSDRCLELGGGSKVESWPIMYNWISRTGFRVCLTLPHNWTITIAFFCSEWDETLNRDVELNGCSAGQAWHQTRPPGFNPWDPHGRKRRQPPECTSLTAKLMSRTIYTYMFVCGCTLKTTWKTFFRRRGRAWWYTFWILVLWMQSRRISEFEVSFFYMSFGLSRAIWWDPVSKNKTRKSRGRAWSLTLGLQPWAPQQASLSCVYNSLERDRVIEGH